MKKILIFLAEQVFHPAVKYFLILAIFCGIMSTASGQLQQSMATRALIPLPVEYRQTDQVFIIQPSTVIVYQNSRLQACAALLQGYIEAGTGWKPAAGGQLPQKNYLLLQTDSIAVTQAEGYHLSVINNGMRLTANNTAGIVYGIQTLRQLWQPSSNHQLLVAGCSITDYPRFAYRGMALDVSRHLFPVSFIKKYIDVLSFYKFNTFHWHLTDDQGWRIEIKKYPALQSVAAWRVQTLKGHKKELPHVFDGKRYGGFYTQVEIKEIVAYAAQRNITIIPEIEMPGHALAALSAYPSLGCTGGPYKPAEFWGVFDDVYCAGNEDTFNFLQNILDEVMELFPSGYIHIGGDECPKTKWKTCAKCQRRINDLQLKDEHALQGYFIKRIEQYVNSKGKNIIGWDEILEGGLAPNATVMSWRGEEFGIAAAQQQHQVIMTPETHLYFDYYQSLYPEEPLAAGGYTPLEKVYSYEPAGTHSNDSIKKYIKGIEAQTWSEYLGSTAQAEYMIFPRAMAAAEIAWTPGALRNYASFTGRLRDQKNMLNKLQVRYADNFDEIQFSSSIDINKNVLATLTSSLPNASISYTTDGSVPSLKSRHYTSPVVINKTCMLMARLYNANQQPAGRIFRQVFSLHKAIGAAVMLTNKPLEKYNPGPMALVNGLAGTQRYNNGQWVGFSGDNAEIVIDLGKKALVKGIRTHILNYHWQRMWAPEKFSIYLSLNGIDFKHVDTKNKFPVNGINSVSSTFIPQKARYIKIEAVNKGTIPIGSYGEGSKALLLLDEIIVE